MDHFSDLSLSSHSYRFALFSSFFYFLSSDNSTTNGTFFSSSDPLHRQWFFIFSLLLAGFFFLSLFFFLFLFLSFFLLQTHSTMFTDQTHKHKPTAMAEDGFFIALNGSGLLHKGFSDLSLVNCLLGLDDDGVVGSLGWDF